MFGFKNLTKTLSHLEGKLDKLELIENKINQLTEAVKTQRDREFDYMIEVRDAIRAQRRQLWELNEEKETQIRKLEAEKVQKKIEYNNMKLRGVDKGKKID